MATVAPKRPGVFVNETLLPLNNTAEVGGVSNAVFVGTNAAGGPTTPTLVTSWTQFTNLFGGFGSGADYLPFSVYEFFNNGGSACYVVRAVTASAVAASLTLKDTQGTPADVLKITAVAPGKWGNSLQVSVVTSSVPGSFDFVVSNGAVTERFSAVSLDPTSSRNVVAVVNSPYAGSQFVRLAYLGPNAWTSANSPDAQSDAALASGTDGTGSADLVAAAKQVSDLNGTFDVNLPGVNTNSVINPLVQWAKDQGNVFLVVDGVAGAVGDSAATNAAAQAALLAGGAALTLDSTVALYGPWVIADDPASNFSGAQRLLPPGGFVLGQYARTDVLRGVQKPAAGTTAVIRGALGPQFKYSATDLDTLNSAGVNALRVIPGAGTCIFGARTLSVGMPDRYLNIRRSLIVIKNALIDLTRFAIFEENDSDLRALIEDLVSQYLRTQWANGVLAGDTETSAFYVKCDDENNPPASVANGFVNISVGVSPQTPAEFIVFNIGQTISGPSVDEA